MTEVLKSTAIRFSQTMSITLLGGLACIASTPTMAGVGDPEIPTIQRPVHLTDQGQYERPYIPVYRTTRDGRIGFNFKGAGLTLYLNTPENITTNYHASPNGPGILATPTAYTAPSSAFTLAAFGGDNGHNSLCEMPNEQGHQKNPYACGNDDCYDVVTVSLAYGNAQQTYRVLEGTPATVRVRNPKTPNARIVDVAFGETVVSPNRLPNFSAIFEPMTTEDGNLMVGRVANTRFTWRNNRTNRNVTGTYDMVYMAAPDDPSRACDVTQWDEVKPLGHAPYDPEVNTRYGFAAQPFRDATGNVLPDNSDIGGSYPWIDSKGNNIAFAAFGTSIDFPTQCVPLRNCGSMSQAGARLQGKTILGLWTQGKMVMLDNLINNIDYSAPDQEDSGHRILDMYAPFTGSDPTDTGWVRVGNGRDNSGTAGLPANPTNTSFQESIENKLNFWDNLQPSTPSDVVWHFSHGAGSDELSFDDYLYENSFVVSSMVQASTNTGNVATQFSGIGDTPTRVQNAAASQHWNVPAFGNVVNTRIERVALGGIHGKGLWHTDQSRIDYTIGAQPRNIRDHDWQISLFIDPRFPDDNEFRTLIAFPDGSELLLLGRRQVRYRDNNTRSRLHLVDFPNPLPSEAWSHIGVQMSNRNRTATLYVNGYAVDTFESNTNFFELSPGVLSVGDHPTRRIDGVRGWIDDFKVIAHRTNPEGWCAQANGRLVGSDGYTSEWDEIAGSYPSSSHLSLTRLLESNGQPTYDHYACFVDYSDDYQAREDTIPRGFTSIRQNINFPEGPLVHNQPRPDSLNNDFCLQCHTPTAPKGLGLEALAFNSRLTAANDPRRQPMQPPARVFGHIPANWLGQGLPATPRIAPAEGFPVDEILLPGDIPTPLWTEGQTLRHISTGQKLSAANLDVALVIASSNNPDSQWRIVDAGQGFVFIDNLGTNRRLRNFGENNVEMVPISYSGDLVQWRIEPNGDGSVFIVNKFYGQKLHASPAQGNIPNSVEPRWTGDNVRWQLLD